LRPHNFAHNIGGVVTSDGTEVPMESQDKQKEQPIAGTAGAATKERSTIEFPYSDLDSAIEIAQAIHQVGGTACEHDQLAAQMKMEAKGGGFRMREIGAKAYGLVTYDRGGPIQLTDAGRRVIDPNQEKAARVDAFLHVPLYSAVFEEFKGGPLPPQAGMERALVKLGVADKVKDKARQVLMRSATQAGFFELQPDRLTKPAVKTAGKIEEALKNGNGGGTGTGGNGGGGGGDGTDYHPFITGLLKTLPKNEGDVWPTKDRETWLKMANYTFKMIYKCEDTTQEIEITLKQNNQN